MKTYLPALAESTQEQKPVLALALYAQEKCGVQHSTIQQPGGLV